MDYYFISDNLFFLSGIQAHNEIYDGNVYCIPVIDAPGKFSPSFGDVVVIHVSHTGERSRIAMLPGMATSRVVIMLKENHGHRYFNDGRFPWLIPHGTCMSDLMACLSQISHYPLTHRRLSVREIRLFCYLSRGYSPQQLEMKMETGAKHLYRLKRKTLMQYGLQHCNAVNIQICRDLITLSGAV
ncbi:helix-turn-helix transcriptional regulator [Klebsiella sp. MISC125]|uniref:helix-turn-helix transcriptional regulator n=1 Tax=Klebsiella sp. MISC125 TaxID=2755386 RepID=UPI003DAA332A